MKKILFIVIGMLLFCSFGSADSSEIIGEDFKTDNTGKYHEFNAFTTFSWDAPNTWLDTKGDGSSSRVRNPVGSFDPYNDEIYWNGTVEYIVTVNDNTRQYIGMQGDNETLIPYPSLNVRCDQVRSSHATNNNKKHLALYYYNSSGDSEYCFAIMYYGQPTGNNSYWWNLTTFGNGTIYLSVGEVNDMKIAGSCSITIGDNGDKLQYQSFYSDKSSMTLRWHDFNITKITVAVGDTTPPSISNFASSATVTEPAHNDYYNISFTCTDEESEISCSWYRMRNSTGSYNLSYNYTNPENYYVDVLNKHARGETVYLKPYCNDSNNNINDTIDEINFTVVNAVPVVNLVSPSIEDPYRRNSFNYTYDVSDADGIDDVDYCELWKDTGTGFSLNDTNTEVSETNDVLEVVGDDDVRNINWTVKCYDNESDEGLSANWTVYIDSKNPVPHFYYPKGDSSTNRSHSNDTFKLDVDVENDHLRFVNLEIRNPNSVLVHNNSSGEISDDPGIEHYTMDYSVDSSNKAEWMLGIYTVYVNATDYASNSAEWTVTFEVVNTPPTAPTLVWFVSPDVAYSDSVLVCEANGSIDAEGDEISYYYAFKDTDNDTVLQGYSPSDTLDCGSVFGCDRGDTIYCYAKAKDDLEFGPEGPQASIIIGNYPPTQDSPTLTSSSGTNYTDEDLTCSNVSTYDADGDTIVNIFVWLRDNLPFNSLYLPFETLFIDYSGSENTVNNNGATLTTGTTGKVGESSYFDGADYIKVNDDISIDFSDDKSWELWVKRSGTGAEVLFDKSDANTTNYKLEFDADNKLKFSYSIPNGEAGNYSWVTSSEAEFNEGNRADVVWDTDHLELNTSKTSGTYTSKVFNATALSSWNDIDWTEGLPYGEELPDNKGSDAGADMSDNKLLLHLNEASGTITDSSGEGNDGTYNGVLYSQTGKFNTALGFDGSDDYVNFGNILGFERTDTFSVEAWIKTSTSGASIVSKLSETSPFPGWYLFVTGGGDPGKVALVLSNVWGSSILSVRTDVTVTDNNWHHVLATYDGSSNNVGVDIYIDGVSRDLSGSPSTLSGSILNSVDFQVSGYDGTNDVFNGLIDEAAVYDVNLTAEEVLKHYKRGILDLDLLVRSCGIADCSDESFIDIMDNPPQSLSVDHNHFFQYKFDFSTEDVSYSPELYNVTVDYTLLNGGGEASLTSSSAITNTAWRHVVVTFDDTGTDNFKLYLDNSLDAYKTETNLPDYKNNDLYIGKDFAGTSYFTGNLDEFRIYNHVLSSEQISNHYNLNYNILDSEETTRSESYICSITPTDGVDDGETNASDSLVIENYPPTVPNLLTPSNYDVFGAFPTFTWSNSTDADPEDEVNYYILFDDDIGFGSPVYSPLLGTSTSHDPEDGVALPNNIIDQYYWKILATDGIENISSATTRTFNYSQWEITFNVSSGEFDRAEIPDVDITSCNYTGFVFDDDTTNPYGPYGFPDGIWQCTFEDPFNVYYDKIITFNSSEDKTVDVIMSEIGELTDEEHTWLEVIYNCVILKDCDLYNLLLEINESAGNTWQHVKPTDESVVLDETEISTTLSSTSNITYDYSIYIPIKAGYGLGDYLPVRIGYWFLDENNETCYNQGDLPEGVTLIEPYCNPIMVQNVGPMGGTVDFRVDLRPDLAEGTYNVMRVIEIDPLGVWYGYGQELIGKIIVTGDVTPETWGGFVERTGEERPTNAETVGRGSDGSEVVSPNLLTGATVSEVKSGLGVIATIMAICLVIVGIGGYVYMRRRK